MVRVQKITRVGTKRRIERIGSQINAVANLAQVNKTLHAAEDAKTLVRTVIDLYCQPRGVERTLGLLVSHWPNAVEVVIPSIAESLDVPIPMEEIWRTLICGALNEAQEANQAAIHIFVDTKAMRKLKPLGELTLSFIASADNGWTIRGNIYQWFKE